MRFPTPHDQLIADMEMRIITDGFAIHSDLPDPDRVTTTYTVGLSKGFGLPELVITNIDFIDAVVLMSWVIEQLQQGESLDDLDPAQFTAVPVHDALLDGDLMSEWRNYYDEEPSTVDVVQLQLGPELACPCCAPSQVDLTDPMASLNFSRRLNRAQRRARKQRR